MLCRDLGNRSPDHALDFYVPANGSNFPLDSKGPGFPRNSKKKSEQDADEFWFMKDQSQATAIDQHIPCIARQPILDSGEDVFGYELLFRESQADDGIGSDLENATRKTINTLSTIGLDVLCDGRIAFINCTYEMLMQEFLLLLPPDGIVVEIQESVPGDQSAMEACDRLKNLGYNLALDRFVPGDARENLVPFAEFMKVDLKAVRPDQCAALATQYSSRCRMLALEVESQSDLATAKSNGFDLFQGYFFRRPERIRAREIPAAQATYLRLLEAISKPEPDISKIEDLIKREPSLCYRLLSYMNSPLLAMSTPVSSIRHALNLLGERELIRWIRMATTLVVGQEKCSDLVLSSLVRARFCELIAEKVKHGESDAFLMGMLSLMDAILDVPIGVIADKLSLSPDTRAQLVGAKMGVATPLSPIYDLMIAREAGQWERVNSLGKKLNLSLYFMNNAYTEAMRWARQVTSLVPQRPEQQTQTV